MSALFPRWSNTAVRVVLLALVTVVGGALTAWLLYIRSPLNTRVGVQVEQPVEFDHRHHVADDGIDCRYCHTSVEKAASAGLPPTSICMGCHAQVWNKSPQLEAVRFSYFTDRPINWNKVHFLPDFVYFNHSIHVNKGIGCISCHGRVDQMGKVMKDQPLSMGWCIDCHRAPERHLRPKTEITNMTWKPSSPAEQAELARQYDVKPNINCTTCHR
jgi:hypothetical protein